VTGPDVPTSNDQGGTDLIQAQVQAIAENAKDLGLTWGIRPATVSNDAPGAITAVYDGDSVAIAMTSLIGPLYAGQRVYAISVPPAANFITGSLPDQQIGLRARVTNSQAIANASQTTLSFNVIDEEVGGNFGSTSLTTITVPVNGIWAVAARASLFSAGGARNYMQIGSITSAIGNVAPSYRQSFVSGETLGSVGATFPLLAGDTFNISIYQEGGANSISGWVSVFRVGGYAT
jgi:hypothetical protein